MNLWNVDNRGETSPLRTTIYLGVASETIRSGRSHYIGHWNRVSASPYLSFNLAVVVRDMGLDRSHSCPRGAP